jgi:hypothetical protein
MDQTLEMPFVLAAVQKALGKGKPEIWNSDQTPDRCHNLLFTFTFEILFVVSFGANHKGGRFLMLWLIQNAP